MKNLFFLIRQLKFYKKCDKIIISITTLINKTIDHLLSLSEGTVGILGPSPLHSDIFRNNNIDNLFGPKVVEETRSFNDSVERINEKLG